MILVSAYEASVNKTSITTLKAHNVGFLLLQISIKLIMQKINKINITKELLTMLN